MDNPAGKASFIGDISGLPAVIAAILVLYATSLWGPAISNDSFSYLVAAHNLANGDGFTVPRIGDLVPITAWPPLFSSPFSGYSLASLPGPALVCHDVNGRMTL